MGHCGEFRDSSGTLGRQSPDHFGAGDQLHQIYVHHYEDGWEEAASCQVTLLQDDAKVSDNRKLFDAMKAVKK